MILKLSAPGKTFLLGEYGVLEGGSCLLAATGPRFEMSIESPGEGMAGGIHPHSPAGRWIRSNPGDFGSIKMTFEDPHHEQGGFGASSAQFIFVNLWTQIQRKNLQVLMSELSIENIWRDFKALYPDTPEGQRPSGGDIVCQWQGGLSGFTPEPFSLESLIWPSSQLDFALVRTKHKVATHTHLEQVKGKDYSLLKKISASAIANLKSGDVESFILDVNGYAKALEVMGLTALYTQELLGRFNSHSAVLAAKGCGALGADVIALFFKPEDRLQLTSYLNAEGFAVEATSSDLSEGLKISVDVNSPQHRHLSVVSRPEELQ